MQKRQLPRHAALLTVRSGHIQLVYENQDDNLNFLKRFVNPSISAPEPYLEKRYGGCSASVAYFHGSEMAEILSLLVNS